jgi:hypothetical protein
MDFELSAEEARVLGSLQEKEMTTPDYYPLSLNALLNACNQKSNRNPVVSYDEKTVFRALDGLKEKRLVWRSDADRVPKYAQGLDKRLNLVRREAAVVCLLLLRGPQTIGELRGRSERLYEFISLEEVAETLQNLEDVGVVRKLPRQPGRKESRYAHLFSGEPEQLEPDRVASPETEALPAGIDEETIATLQQEVAALRADLEEMRQGFLEFKRQFE